ncbi:TPA: hypothetical protein SMR79_001962 [Proteus mirabilis]|nr:hypothetical protein [Proteus mirabilis]
MKKEIGGYFELESLINNPWYQTDIKLNSGRAALLLLIKEKNIKKIHLPYFLCDSVKNYLNKEEKNIQISYYHIDDNFLPKIKSENLDKSYLYIVNYYGLIPNKIILQYKKKYNNIIIDNTQAFFQPPLIKVPTIYSCRKYFGVPDGAYLFHEKINIDHLQRIKITNSLAPLTARTEECASKHYQEHVNNENKFENIPIQYMSLFSENILGAINYNYVIEKRNSNFSYLNKRLSQFNKLKVLEKIIPNAPFAYPLLVENAVNLKQILIRNKIYIPTLWQNVIDECAESSIEYNYAKNILPLPCDQRYDINDMKLIVDIIIKNKV